MDWTLFATLVAVIVPVVGVPLAVGRNYLKSIYARQVHRDRELMDRMARLEDSVRDVSRALRALERRYTTKEEWVRELTQSRFRLERLTEQVTALQLEVRNGHGMVAALTEAVQAMRLLTATVKGAPTS